MAYLNEETERQIKQFNEIRIFIARLNIDQDLMKLTIEDAYASCSKEKLVIQNKAL